MYRKRCETLVQTLLAQQKEENVCVYLHTRPEPLRNRDNPYKYRPDSNFYYYTGLDSTDMAVRIYGTPDGIKTTLYMPEPDPHRETWTGPMTTFKEMEGRFDIVLPIEQLDVDENEENEIDGRVKVYATIPGIGLYFDVLVEIIDKQRLIKSPEEIEMLKGNCRASAEAFREVMTNWTEMRARGELQTESALDGWFTYQFMKRGANGLAYPNIVASGKNATVLHYEKNTGPLRSGDLVLVDAGGEYGYYASDITRTWPISGKFTKEQKEVYDIVRETQRACVAMVSPGRSVKEIHEHAQRMITEGAQKLGLPDDYDYFPHSIGHWMGMDVHDCMTHRINEDNLLQSGMIVTVEPGMYVPDRDDMGKYRGIGVRLEDDILVTEEGRYNMTSAAPFWEDLVEARAGDQTARGSSASHSSSAE